MTLTPATRTLDVVLREALTRPAGLRLITCVFGTAVGGVDATAYANVIIEGTEIKVPKLNNLTATPGKVAYVLATPDFLLCLGTVVTT